jgi:hypothetical protein
LTVKQGSLLPAKWECPVDGDSSLLTHAAVQHGHDLQSTAIVERQREKTNSFILDDRLPTEEHGVNSTTRCVEAQLNQAQKAQPLYQFVICLRSAKHWHIVLAA